MLEAKLVLAAALLLANLAFGGACLVTVPLRCWRAGAPDLLAAWGLAIVLPCALVAWLAVGLSRLAREPATIALGMVAASLLLVGLVTVRADWLWSRIERRIRALSAIGREIGQCLAVLGLGLLAGASASRAEEGRDLV